MDSFLGKGLFIIYWEYGTGVLWERPMEKVLIPSKKFPKKLVSRQWKKGKKSMSRIITLILTLRQRGNME